MKVARSSNGLTRCGVGFTLLLACACTVAHAGTLDVHVYAKGPAAVSETRSLTLQGRGGSLLWAPVSPRLDLNALEFVLPAGGTAIPVMDLRLDYDLKNHDALLKRYLGSAIEVVSPETGRSLKGTLLDVKDGRPALVRSDAGALHVKPAGEVVLPPNEAVRHVPALAGIQLADIVGTQDVNLRYRTDGLRWETVYAARYDTEQATVAFSGVILLRNDTDLAFEDAAWRFFSSEMRESVAGLQTGPQAVEYTTLAGPAPRISVPAHYVMRLPLVSASAIPALTLYTYDPLSNAPGAGKPDQSVQRVAAFTNRPELGTAGLGVPLPPGRLKLARRGTAGTLQSIGEKHLAFVEPGDWVEVPMGPVPGLRGERRQTPFSQFVDTREQEQEIHIRLFNDTTNNVEISAFERPWGRWTIPSSSHAFEEMEPELIRFDVPVPARGETEISYKLRLAY